MLVMWCLIGGVVTGLCPASALEGSSPAYKLQIRVLQREIQANGKWGSRQMLAEPVLVTMTGRPAMFLAGSKLGQQPWGCQVTVIPTRNQDGTTRVAVGTVTAMRDGDVQEARVTRTVKPGERVRVVALEVWGQGRVWIEVQTEQAR